ncbi:MAG TPA: hypothetical protein PKD27_08400, partial [Tepidiformaceae bacterium]|nr:hypothetical protein [Tepidiformaceae bacterium]
MLLLTATPARAQALLEELPFFAGAIPVARLPEREALPYEFTRDEPIAALERAHALALLRGERQAIVVASWAGISEHCAPPGIAAEGIRVDTGMGIAPTDLMARLEAAGYAIEPLADAPGTASRRGGIVDIFPADREQPYRIEFFGDQVESIRVLDLATQRSAGRVDTMEVPPGSTSSHAARDAARTIARPQRRSAQRRGAGPSPCAPRRQGGFRGFRQRAG